MRQGYQMLRSSSSATLTRTKRIWYRRTVLSSPPPEGTFVFLSDLLGRPALGPGGERLGKVVDFLADTAEPAYPKITALRVRAPRGELRRGESGDLVESGPHGT